ncbi:OV-16 antigen [Trichonephila clavipes]|nr:OV-16 antigen [Trichonephila clavipes]
MLVPPAPYPDSPKPTSPYLASYRNWVVEDIPGDRFYKGYVVSSFAPPNPPFGSEPHRIIFLIYQQPRDEKLQESFDDSIRTNFKIETFVRKRNLIGPIAGSFIDEAHFWLNGYVNKQNCRIWSEANPQVYVETPLHAEKLTVWCALWAGGILQKRLRPQRYSQW